MSGTVQPLQTASQTIASGGYGAQPVGFGYYPTEGSRVVTLAYNWSQQSAYSEDLAQALVAHGIETSIQGIYVDNSGNAETVQITIQGTGQLILVPPSSQGVFPAFFPPGASFTIQSSVAGVAPALQSLQVTRLYLLNVPPQAAGVWPAPAIGSNGILNSETGPANFTSNITGTTVVRPLGTIGRMFTVSVLTTTAVGTITLSSGPEGAGNNIAVIPIGATAGTVLNFQGGFPYLNGLQATFDGGATGNIAISWS